MLRFAQIPAGNSMKQAQPTHPTLVLSPLSPAEEVPEKLPYPKETLRVINWKLIGNKSPFVWSGRTAGWGSATLTSSRGVMDALSPP